MRQPFVAAARVLTPHDVPVHCQFTLASVHHAGCVGECRDTPPEPEPLALDTGSEFRRLIAIARVLPNRFEGELAAGQGRESIGWDDFPAVTGVTLGHWA